MIIVDFRARMYRRFAGKAFIEYFVMEISSTVMFHRGFEG